MFRRMAAAIALTALVLAAPLSAQQRRLPAVAVTLGAGVDFGLAVPVDVFDRYNTLSANSESKWGGATIAFPKLFTNGFGLSTTLKYGIMNHDMYATGSNSTFVWPSDMKTVAMERSHRIKAKTLYADMGLYFQAGEVVRLEVGPYGEIGFLPQYTVEQWMVTPGEVFENGERYQIRSSSSDPNSVVLTTGLNLRASLEIPLMKNLALVPSAYVRGGVLYSNIYTGTDIDFNRTDPNGGFGAAGVGLGVLFGNTNGEEIPEPPPPPEVSGAEADSSTRSSLEARVDLFGVDRAGRRSDTFVITPRRTLHRMKVPLVPVFHFEPHSAALPEQYAGYTPATREAFSLDALAGTAAGDLYFQGLNIIGMRLRSEPTATIMITGSVGSGEPSWFATARAEAVRGYLARTWGVSGDRMSIATAPAPRAGQGGGSLAAITSSSRRLLAPIVTEWIEESAEGMPVAIEPQIAASAGVRQWRATVMYKGRELGVLRSTEAASAEAIDISLVLRDFESDASASLAAELVVEDSTGAVVLARDEMNIVVDSAELLAPSAAHRIVSTHILPGTSAAATDEALDHIVAAIEDSASVAIGPAAGIDGDEVAGVDSRIEHVGERLRAISDRAGKRITALEIKPASSAMRGSTGSGRAFEGRSSAALPGLIELTVVEQ